MTTALARYRATGEVVKAIGRPSAARFDRRDDLPDERLWSSFTHGSYGEPNTWDEATAASKFTGAIYVANLRVANRLAKLWSTNWLRATLATGEEREIERAQILDAIRHPNPIDRTGAALVKRTWFWLGTTGNAYWYVMRDALGAPRGFWPFFPHLTRLVVTPGEFIVGVNYYPDGLGAEPDFFPIEDVVHFKLENPNEHLYGYSPLRAAAYETNTSDAIRVYESNWFKNQMRPDYVVSVGGVGGPNMMGDLERVRARFRMYHQGARRFGEPLFLPPDSKIQQIQFSLADSQFLELAGATEDRIFMIHSIPKWVVKPEGFATRSAATEAKIEFAEDTIEPAAAVIYDTLNVCVINDPRNVPRPDGVELELCHDSAAPVDVEFTHADARENFKAGLITRDEARETLGWDPAVSGGEEYASQPSPFGAAPMVSGPADQQPAKALDAEAIAAVLLKAIRPEPPVIETRALSSREISHPTLDTTEKRAEFWAKAIKPQDDHAKAATAVMRSFFRKQADRVLSDIERAVGKLTAKHVGWTRAKTVKSLLHAMRAAPLIVKMGKDEFGIDVTGERDRLAETLRPIVTNAAGDGGDLLARQLGIEWDVENPKAARWLDTHLTQTAADITDTTAQLLSATVRDGVADGKTTQEIMRDLRTVFGSWSDQSAEGDGVLPGYRAARIARTEIGIAFNHSQQLVLEDAKDEGIVESKMWLTARDSYVRDSHNIDGETVAVDGEFSNGLKYPGDPSAGPGEICNCRCTIAAVVARG